MDSVWRRGSPADSGACTAPALPFARMRHPPADLTPPTIAALGAALAETRHVRIVGRQSLGSRTSPPPPGALVVSTAALTELRIEPLDLIARVEAGVELAELRRRLDEHGLVWPVERLEPGGTVGGLIASGRGSAVRGADAPARRWLLGATVLLASGEAIQVGGATVKFSAGYGLTHAMWGSGGLLGALAEVTLRLRHAVAADSAAADVTSSNWRGCSHRRTRCARMNCLPDGASPSGKPLGANCRESSAPTAIAPSLAVQTAPRRRPLCLKSSVAAAGPPSIDRRPKRPHDPRRGSRSARPWTRTGGSSNRQSLSLAYTGGIGAWRSQVARIVRDDEVGGSNPLAPTSECGQ